MLAADLAELYGVTTKRLNEQVKRNRDRFPEDFMFQLMSEEKSEVVAICDHLAKIKYSPVLRERRKVEHTIRDSVPEGPSLLTPQGEKS